MKIFLLINVGILTFLSRKNSILCYLSLQNAEFLEQLKFHAQLSLAWKKFYNLGARLHSVFITIEHELTEESTMAK